MNERVIEAATIAAIDADGHDCWNPASAPDYREIASAAINAADAARAADVKAAVATVGYWAWRCGMGRGQERDDRRDRLKAAYRELFALLNIPDTES